MPVAANGKDAPLSSVDFPDTIVALSSGRLPAGVAVIRVSGKQTRSAVETIAGKGVGLHIFGLLARGAQFLPFEFFHEAAEPFGAKARIVDKTDAGLVGGGFKCAAVL